MMAKDLTVLHDDNGTFVDWSIEASDYNRDSFVLPMVAAEDKLYVGLYKEFNTLYSEMKVVNAVSQTFTAEYWNGSAWVDLDVFVDNSKGFTRSGFLKWDKPSDWASTSVNSESAFWIRLTPSADLTALTEVQGLNLLFADDNDLQVEFSEILSYLGTKLSYATYHQAARDEIVQGLRNKGNTKTSNNQMSQIQKWDLLDIDEVKRGAVFYALSKIFFELSDREDDKWYQRYKDYDNKANASLEAQYLSLDLDDSGDEKAENMVQYQSVGLFRQ